MSILSFIAGFITALVFVGVIIIALFFKALSIFYNKNEKLSNKIDEAKKSVKRPPILA